MSGRWDPERFHRERERYERAGGHVLEERDVVDRGRGRYFEEHERFHEDQPRPRRGQLDLDDRYDGRPRAPPIPSERGGMGRGSIDDDRSSGGGRGRFEEEKVKVYYEEDRSGRARREPIFFEDVDRVESPPRSAIVPVRSGGSQRARRQSIHIERDYVSPPPTRTLPSRPKYIRRQSSLDTFDRRPLPRYGDYEDYKPTVTVPVPIPRRRRSPVRRFEEREYEEIRIPESDYYPEEQRDVREVSTREYRFKSSDFDEPEETTRRGKTRMPRRLVEKSAIDMLGYPFEEEVDEPDELLIQTR